MLLLIGPVAKLLVKTIGKKTIKKVIGSRPIFARVATLKGDAALLEATAAQLEDIVKPAAHKQKGSKGAYVLVDSASGKVITLTLWDSLEHMEASAEWAADSIAQTAEAVGATELPEIDVYEALVRPEN